MHKIIGFSLLGLGLTLATVGCKQTQQVEKQAPLAEPVPIIERYSGLQAEGLEMQQLLLIKDAEQMAQLNAPSVADEVEIDWDTQDLVLLALGSRNTGGYWCQITALQIEGKALFVQGVVNRPGEQAMVTQAITYPWSAAVIPNVDVSTVRSDLMSVEGKSPGEL